MSTTFVSPVDRVPLTVSDADGSLVSDDGAQRFSVVDNVPHLVRPERIVAVDEFTKAYGAVRAAEGRASPDGGYYRSLPHVDTSGKFTDQWGARARTYELLQHEIGAAPLRIVDAGAGNCWLAARLVSLGHSVVALDVNVDSADGLGAHVHYRESFDVARAELGSIPLPSGSRDVVVFNASAHYLVLDEVVSEAVRVLCPGGRIMIADSPLYADSDAGETMLREMSDYILSLGVKPARYEGPGYITDDALLASGVGWRHVVSETGTIRKLRDRLARCRAGRELARMPLLVAVVSTDTVAGLR